MKSQRKTWINFISATMGFILLLSSCFAFTTLYKCSKRGTISFTKDSSQAFSCSCCKHQKQTISEKELVHFQCCQKITFKSHTYLNLDYGQNFVTAATFEAVPYSFNFVGKTKATFPKPSAKVSSGVSPPVYLLKQSFLI